MANEWTAPCKRCESIDPNTRKFDPKRLVRYSDRMFKRMEESGESRPMYCEICKKEVRAEKAVMGTGYQKVRFLPGVDLSVAIPGELGMVYHPPLPHTMSESPAAFDETQFGKIPDKIADLYQWLNQKNHQVAIIIGPTGSGKSTALPYWLMFPPKGIPDDFFIRDGQILITQPRIVATTSIAGYLGVMLGSSVGKGYDIGYRHSKDRNADRFNAAFLATDGSLINMIMKGQLADLGIIMIDEAHERSENIDIILRLLKDQLPLYPHLKLLVVSATMNKELFLNFFGPETAKIIELEAERNYQIEVNYAVDAQLPYDNPASLRNGLVPELVKKIMWLLEEQIAGRKTRGDILAFLHGVKPIETAITDLNKAIDKSSSLKNKIEIYPLYSDLDDKKKDLALKGSGSGKIRVIVSTNVAEASITVDGIRYVVETGVENQANFDSVTRQNKIGLTLISQANAKQRWGRSGRTAPGEVYCLYTKEQFETMPEFPVAAIKRTSMEEIILLLKKLGVDDLNGGWIENPKDEELSKSLESLRNSKALDADDALTEYGSLLRDFAFTAPLTDLIIMADRFGCAVEVATLLPVIKNGGHRNLLMSDDGWDQKERQKAKKAHEILWKNCKDDVEFILKLYSLWSHPPRKDWAKEFYVNEEKLKEVETERIQILQLLNARKKDRNFREINFHLLDRTRLILAYCIPYKGVAQEAYVYTKPAADPGTSATYLMALPPEKKKIIDENKEKSLSLFSLAREFIGLEQNMDADTSYARIFEGTDVSLEEAIDVLKGEWEETISKTHPLGQILEVKVKSVISGGVFVFTADKTNGYISIREINKNYLIKDATDVVKFGENWQARVIGYDTERQNLQMSLSIPENSPLNKYQRGQILEGKVASFADFGTFVVLPLGYQGLIHISNMGKRVNKPSDMLKIGQTVSVRVLDVREEGGKLRIGLALTDGKSVL